MSVFGEAFGGPDIRGNDQGLRCVGRLGSAGLSVYQSLWPRRGRKNCATAMDCVELWYRCLKCCGLGIKCIGLGCCFCVYISGWGVVRFKDTGWEAWWEDGWCGVALLMKCGLCSHYPAVKISRRWGTILPSLQLGACLWYCWLQV